MTSAMQQERSACHAAAKGYNYLYIRQSQRAVLDTRIFLPICRST